MAGQEIPRPGPVAGAPLPLRREAGVAVQVHGVHGLRPTRGAKIATPDRRLRRRRRQVHREGVRPRRVGGVRAPAPVGPPQVPKRLVLARVDGVAKGRGEAGTHPPAVPPRVAGVAEVKLVPQAVADHVALASLAPHVARGLGAAAPTVRRAREAGPEVTPRLGGGQVESPSVAVPRAPRDERHEVGPVERRAAAVEPADGTARAGRRAVALPASQVPRGVGHEHDGLGRAAAVALDGHGVRDARRVIHARAPGPESTATWLMGPAMLSIVGVVHA